MTGVSESDSRRFVAIIDQDKVTDEVRNIALKYDPLNRSGGEGFHVTEDGELHIEDSKVMDAHRLIEKRIPNDAVRIVRLPTERGRFVHQYGSNGFRLYELPQPREGAVIGLLGRNGTGKSTAIGILGGQVSPNFGTEDVAEWGEASEAVSEPTLRRHFKRLRDGEVEVAFKPQRVDALEGGGTLEGRLGRGYDEELIGALGLYDLLDKAVEDLSGGERQRMAIAEALTTDADLYVFDEPTSFLDVQQRSAAARAIRERVTEVEAAAIVVEHDLTALDLIADAVHVLYGDPGAFGIVSERLPVRRGINEFLEGHLRGENVRIRDAPIRFPDSSQGSELKSDIAIGYDELRVDFGGFHLHASGAEIRAGETVGIVGRNGLGKTTLARAIGGELEPAEGVIDGEPSVSYKPQHLEPDGSQTVAGLLAGVTDVDSRSFKTRVRDPLGLECLMDHRVDAISGGELQRVAIGLCLAREADVYLLDEPSAYLDADRRASVSAAIARFAGRTGRPAIVIDHDLFVIDRLADRLIVFAGEPGRLGRAGSPRPKREGMNDFLSSIDITFRRDERTGRPRVNKPGSRLDRRQKASGEHYYGS